MFIVVSYDIVDDKRRTKVHKTLKNFGTPVQYSVFECQLDSPALERLKNPLNAVIRTQEQSVRY